MHNQRMDSLVSRWLGGDQVLGHPLNSNLDLARATREGLPAQAAFELAVEVLGEELQLPSVDSPLHARILVAVKEMRSGREGTGGLIDLSEAEAAFARNLGPLCALLISLFLERRAHLRRFLTPPESDIVVRTATSLARAEGVLGDKKKAVRWLRAPNRALGGEVPMSLLDTSAGEHVVQSLLDRIEYGVYS
jgi:hypothetical protein